MNVLFFGTPEQVVPLVSALQQRFTLTGVVTTPDQKAGRKQILTASPVKKYAIEHNIPVFQPDSLRSFDLNLLPKQVDLFVVAAYGKLIPQNVLDIPRHGAINVHPSLLPAFRGPTPIQTSLLEGIKQSGITFMKMDSQLDHGPIINSIPYTIESTDTFASLMSGMFAKAAQELPEVIERFVSGQLTTHPQNDDEATFTKHVTKQDGYIDLQNPPSKEQLNRMIRAYYPWPNVWTRINVNGIEKILKFLPEGKLQMEGKSVVSKKDFLNGYPSLSHVFDKI